MFFFHSANEEPAQDLSGVVTLDNVLTTKIDFPVEAKRKKTLASLGMS